MHMCLFSENTAFKNTIKNAFTLMCLTNGLDCIANISIGYLILVL